VNNYGFVKVASVTPQIKVGDVDYNFGQISAQMDEASQHGAKVTCFPELCLTGYTCGDLFTQDLLLRQSLDYLEAIVAHSARLGGLFFIGMPFGYEGALYNCLAAVSQGKLLGLTTKTFLPNYGEFYEMRQFRSGPRQARLINVLGTQVPFGPGLLYQAKDIPGLVVGAEICEDLWSPIPPSIDCARKGATVIVNASASDETIGKRAYRRDLVKGQSARLICAYLYANAGDGESTQDLVFAGHKLVAENGTVLVESISEESGIIYADIDLPRLLSERRRNTTFIEIQHQSDLVIQSDESSFFDGNTSIHSSIPARVFFYAYAKEDTLHEFRLDRTFAKHPFVPSDTHEKEARCEEILTIQALGLKKRLQHTNSSKVVVGISGGLDSTLALLVCVRAFDMLKLNRTGIIGITMPCFGTTDRTYQNAWQLMEILGVSIHEINIEAAVLQHFSDIGQDRNTHDVVFENAQARERTQVLMDVANKEEALVIGTGDMSELALGWATYNGDHMSMYGVNVSIPKTLVRHLVAHVAHFGQALDGSTIDKNTRQGKELAAVLGDILDTPVSPELIPPKDGEISQKTEDLVGPYELHDFFLYYMMRFGYEPSKLLFIAERTFEGDYTKEEIKKWLIVFYRRFFSQQFKRSCLPDGPKVGTVSLSPRGDWRMPSDASARLWLSELGA